ncbi:hemolysin III-like protein isoform 1 [Galdieria sulphuraria]|uniref:Hemolysin III-like protein isoform 1 n=1 Tax=Galdieria sulphuraria TaxID=130081 RepID=M2WR23_GALSU|nr:hemolysin III-like protein isoform 1 [Galdieria sulphuraria]EME26255.1 hemolysin III-like protein isoform 1 [Galdieria sulphuraria]|eukprot:XP_005702775.1 hemolysin III-like protein isoform 1 [Galdieria sulphuraria]
MTEGCNNCFENAYWKYLQCCERHKVEPDPTICMSLYIQNGCLLFSKNLEGHQIIPVLELAKADSLQWVEELSYHSRRMSPLTSLLLMKLCETLPQLKVLNVSGTFLGDENGAALCQVLSKCENLTELRLAHCKLRRRSTQALMQHFRKSCWPKLQVLDVRNNLLCQEDVELLRSVAKSCSFSLLDDGNRLRDEVLNSVTHGVGFLSSIFAGSSLVLRAQNLQRLERLGIYIYVLSLCLMCVNVVFLNHLAYNLLFDRFASSTLYHSFFRLTNTKQIFRTLDHCSIFILIAGTYTPFVQRFLWYQRMTLGLFILSVIWCLALLGIVLSSGFLEQDTFTRKLRIVLAVVMGWLVLGTSKILREEMPDSCFLLVLMGGIFYTIGIPFYVKVKQASRHLYRKLNTLYRVRR